MIANALTYAKRCHTCLVHANFIHQPLEYLHISTSSWPFEIWGMDIVRSITPPLSNGHCFILVKADYIFKWAVAIPMREMKTTTVIKLVKHYVIYRLGVSQ